MHMQGKVRVHLSHLIPWLPVFIELKTVNIINRGCLFSSGLLVRPKLTVKNQPAHPDADLPAIYTLSWVCEFWTLFAFCSSCALLPSPFFLPQLPCCPLDALCSLLRSLSLVPVPGYHFHLPKLLLSAAHTFTNTILLEASCYIPPALLHSKALGSPWMFAFPYIQATPTTFR